MMILTDLTKEQLRALNKNQIISAIGTYLAATYTRKQLIQGCLDRDTDWDTPICTYGADGQIESQNEIERDVDTDAQISRKYTAWTYYNSGEVNVITIQTFDETDTLKKQKKIKHYKDGRQPEEQ
jgi:hypothetical protein